jgi:hypothetical protein
LEEWNWQVKGSGLKQRDEASEEKRKDSNISELDGDQLEKELIKIDQQLEKEGGYYFRQGRSTEHHTQDGLMS